MSKTRCLYCGATVRDRDGRPIDDGTPVCNECLEDEIPRP
jgi:formylmethanofuran dehydrogenase subunit E